MKKLKLLTLVMVMLPMISLAQQQKIERTFTGVEEIDISVGPGDAIFERSSDNKVYLTVTHDIDDYQPSIQQKGDRLKIEEDKGRGNWRRSVTWRFLIPDNTEISFNTGSGDLDVLGITSEVSVNSGSGDLNFSNFKGEANGNTGSGDINFENVEGELNMNTGSGDVEGDNVSGYLSVNTGSGEVEFKNLTLTNDSQFNAGSGDVEISLAAALDYDIFLNSGSGDAVLDFNGNKIEGLIVMKANKERGKIVAPFEFDKEEEEDRGGHRNVTIKKTAKIGKKDISINVSTGSGTAEIEQ